MKEVFSIDNLRKMGSVALMAGYTMLMLDLAGIALPIRLLGNFLILPFALREKLKDVIVMQLFFASTTLFALSLQIVQAHPEIIPDESRSETQVKNLM